MVVILNVRKDDFILTNENPWLNSFLVRSKPLSRKVSLDCPFLIALSVFANVYLPIDEARNETTQQCHLFGRLR
jgi:Flp pilus assembly protein protease CpaA